MDEPLAGLTANGDPRVLALVDEVVGAEWPPMTNHKQAKHPLHKAALLVDMGLRGTDAEGRALAARLLAHPTAEGALQIQTQIPERFGGSGEPAWGWMGCDAPLVVSILARMGLGDDDRVQAAARHLEGLADDRGWPCSGSIPGFRGPGRKSDPCPYATLLATRALSDLPGFQEGTAVQQGAEMLLSHWANRTGRKLYLFGIGTDFRRAKYPLVWYDLLHVVDVLSRVPTVHGDPRFQEMLALLLGKADGEGRVTPESVWMAFKGFDFAQKREPSATLGRALERIRRRVG